jgi:hypothetical protein
MNKTEFKQSIKMLTPPLLWNHTIGMKEKRRKNIDNEFANFILDSAIEYSKHIEGDTGSFDRRLRSLITTDASENDCNSIIQDILTAFMPKYEKNLYQYYKNQEYLIFYRFLTYPFNCDMSVYFLPYKAGLARFQSNDILDYGSGIPYGLINSLLNNRSSINSIALIDLDLIHFDFVQFLIKRIAPDVKLNIYKATDTESFPEIEGKYNFFYGKDIFEHLSAPLENLRKLMSYSKQEAVCYFDFQDHGEKIYQHITPDIAFLSEEMVKMGFQFGTKTSGLSEFERKL